MEQTIERIVSFFRHAAQGLEERKLLEVYVAPISVLMIAAWLVTIALRWIAGRFQPLRHVWRPALFGFAVYIIVLSSTVMITAQ